MKKILFVAMQMSTHTVRWINQISDSGWDVHLFPVSYMPVHPDLRGTTVHQPWIIVKPRQLIRNLLGRQKRHRGSTPISAIKDDQPNYQEVPIYPIPIPQSLLRYVNGVMRVRLGESEATAPLAYGPWVLANLIKKLRPDLIHSLEFQHCGYNVLRAKDIVGKCFPKWLATNWGSDIYYYRNFEDHRRQISRLLQNIDYYSCECDRDVELAKELGLRCKVMPVMPNTGGLDLEQIQPLRNQVQTSRRKIIMVKGYQHFAGRALTALEALERCAVELRGFEVVVFSASPETYRRVDELRSSVGLSIRVQPYSDHSVMLRLFSQARVYLGISISDAISTSMLEAMAMGAFPIQTDTSCCSEWIECGRSGFEIPVDDPELIAERLKSALLNDELVDSAAELNWKTVKSRLDQRILRERAKELYQSILTD